MPVGIVAAFAQNLRGRIRKNLNRAEEDGRGLYNDRRLFAKMIATSTHPDAFTAARAWLYVAIVTVGYMVSRGLAKSGSKQHYDER